MEYFVVICPLKILKQLFKDYGLEQHCLSKATEEYSKTGCQRVLDIKTSVICTHEKHTTSVPNHYPNRHRQTQKKSKGVSSLEQDISKIEELVLPLYKRILHNLMISQKILHTKWQIIVCFTYRSNALNKEVRK